MRFEMTVNMDNAAFGEDAGAELARILRDAADDMEAGADGDGGAIIKDCNGNTVGEWRVDR